MKYLKAMYIAAFAISLLFLTACGGGDDKKGDDKKEVKLILTPGTAPVVLGQPAIFTVGTTNTDFSVSTDKAAAGCVKTNATTVTCTPTAADTYTLTITATADSKVTAKATITVSELSVSVDISSTSETVVVGQSTSFTITTENTDFEISTSPATGAGCVKASNTLVTCTPTAAGSYTLTVTPTKDTTKAKTANITATPLISVSVSTDAINGIPGQPVTFTVATEGTDFAIDAPEGITCEKDGNKVTCTPSTATEYVVTVTATADETKKQEVTIIGTGSAMVLLAVGTDGGTTFSMGCSTDQYSYCPRVARPPHDVTLTKDFYIGKYEVTQAEWKAVMGAENNPSEFQGDNLPVTNISWEDVQEFIAQLNVQTGRTYRLPTEAEWEYAARGGQPEYEFSGAHFDIEDVAWYNGNLPEGTTPQPQPVGGKLPNDFGLYDMSGNVAEWVQDNYLSSYNSFTDPQIDPTGPEPTEQGYKVVRNGSWHDLMANSMVVGRGGISPVASNNRYGFRLALTIPDPATPTAEPTFFESASATVSGVWDSAVSGIKSLWNSITK